jgi:cellulose synthase operon protein B
MSIAGLLLLLCGSSLIAETDPEPQQPSTAQEQPEGQGYDVALGALMSTPGPVLLSGASAQYDFHIGLSPRVEVSHAVLRLRLANSIALVQERSQLRVGLNGATVAQVALTPSGAQNEFEIELPALLLVPGFNRLTLSAAQHYTVGCEDPNAPELWTEIDTRTSTLELTTWPRRIAPSLADLDAVMGPAAGNATSHIILTAADLDDALLTSGAHVAEAIGLRLRYHAPRIRHARARALPADATERAASSDIRVDLNGHDGADVVLLGTRDQLAPYISSGLRSSITDAYLAVRPLGDLDQRLIFIVSGTSAEEVKRAATALGRLEFPHTDSDSALIRSLGSPQRAIGGDRHFVSLGSSYSFADLGYRTRTIRGYGREQLSLQFDLPPDFYVAESENLELAMSFAYGANLRADSVLNVMLNGSFQQAIPMNNTQGAVLREYRIQIPLRAFRHGPNVVTFEPVMVPMITGECLAMEVRNLVFTMFDHSQVRVPKASHYVPMPDLALIATTGFPYLQPPNLPARSPQPAVTVYGSDSASAGAAWTFLAKLAQAGGAGASGARVGTEPSRNARHQLILGAWDAIDPALLAAAPVNFGGSKPAPIRAASPAPDPGFFARVLARATNMGASLPEAPPTHMQVTSATLLREHGLFTAFESPFARGHKLSVVTAATPELLLARVDALVTPAIWNQLAGDVTLWTEPDRTVYSRRAGQGFMLGNPGMADALRYQLSLHPWILIAVVLVLLVLAAWLTNVLLNRRTRRLYGDDVTVRD